MMPGFCFQLGPVAVSYTHLDVYKRQALGTGSLFTGSSSDGRLLFPNIPCGQFACAENAEGRVDTFVREFT